MKNSIQQHSADLIRKPITICICPEKKVRLILGVIYTVYSYVKRSTWKAWLQDMYAHVLLTLEGAWQIAGELLLLYQAELDLLTVELDC